ncbi:TetR/AcrR family transcriptional regulator [Aeromicrobium chenweiae]|uniref:TetR/AcrR family transcriptional regulator n=1 Tax=Aeromicrobium chenweiae TaxID=2079793 RepID=A0A2S0WJ65_9ACTN|nr:TetR/AcrR family transcriptional regulator [Aeromicrobium chenweiae]AWB91280.1 TetR/AcrR family transcriptional regulator [Aeromicrobium chenweiae]TGN31798.1 TetR/AcrR family transcriptional regulator [Aeromicrobium chenweiae]
MREPAGPSAGRRRHSGRKGDAREAAILDAAEELLAREGFDHMTVEGIAKGAGITRGALYFYFGSKQDVLTALVARTLLSMASAADRAASTMEDDAATIVQTSLRSTETSWREHGRVMQAAVDLGPLVPEIGSLWKATVDTYIDSMTAVLERAGAPDARHLATALCWMTERTYYWSHVESQAEHLGDVTATCHVVWMSALAAR